MVLRKKDEGAETDRNGLSATTIDVTLTRKILKILVKFTRNEPRGYNFRLLRRAQIPLLKHHLRKVIFYL